MRILLVTCLVLAACGTAKPGGMSGPSIGGSSGPKHNPSAIESGDILARDAVAEATTVKHILIGWRDLEESYQGRMDPRAVERSMTEAEALAGSLLERARGGEAFEALMIEFSEDAGTAKTAAIIRVTEDAELVEPFISLSLRLQPGEIGLVRTQFGFHIIKRVA